MSLKMAKMAMDGTIAYEELLGVSISPSKVISLWDRASSTGYLFLKETNEFIKYVESTNTFTRWTWSISDSIVNDIAISVDGANLIVACNRFTSGALYHMETTGVHTVVTLGESRLSLSLSVIPDSFGNVYLWGISQEDNSRGFEKGRINLTASPKYQVLYREWAPNSLGFNIGRSGKIYLKRENANDTEIYADTGNGFLLEKSSLPKAGDAYIKSDTDSVVWIEGGSLHLVKSDDTEVVYPTVFPAGASPSIMSLIGSDVYMCETRAEVGQPYTEHIVKYTISGDEATIGVGTVIATTGGLRNTPEAGGLFHQADPYGERREQFTLKYS